MRDIKTYCTQPLKRLFTYRRFFCFWLLLCLPQLLPAQDVDDYASSFKDKRSLYFTWDSKISFISNEYAQVKSLKLGFDFGGRTKFGIGYNWYKGHIVRDFGLADGAVGSNLKFRYVSIFTEYVYFLNKRWEATIPAQVGLGVMQYNREFSKERMPGAGGIFAIYEPSSTITYRFLKYFGVGLGIGYRLVLLFGSNPQREGLQSPIVMLRTKLYFDYLYKDVKKLLSKD